MVINNVVIADAVDASVEKMVDDVKKLNPDVQVITSSLKTGKGLDEIMVAIESYMK